MKASLLSCLIAALVLPRAFAQSPAPTNAAPAPLPPVTVIGEKPALPQPETVSASVVAGDLFERGGFANTRDLTAIAPNTSLFDGNNPRTPRFSVRGFRENNFLIGEPAVALYVDDVHFSTSPRAGCRSTGSNRPSSCAARRGRCMASAGSLG